jgi:hypothetical protein
MFEYLKALFAKLFSNQPTVQPTVEQRVIIEVNPVMDREPVTAPAAAPTKVTQKGQAPAKPKKPKQKAQQTQAPKAPAMQPKKKKPAPKKPV